ncbi:MAG: ABC transporter ATP-binding protein [Candidatus Hodarchaeota archaeon]
MTYAIEAIDISKTFTQAGNFKDVLIHPSKKKKTIALKNVSFKLKESQVCTILGPNGAGKTTLIKILCTLILPDKGGAYVNGYDISKEEQKVRASIGLVIPRERSFYWRLSGRKNLEFFASLYTLPKLEANARINHLLELTGLKERADDRVDNYSLGMKHRLAIARGLLNDPPILFMDEPTNSLDPYSAHKLREFIKEKLVKEQGKTIFLATHNMQEAEKLSDRLMIIDQGKIRAQGELKDFQRILGAELIIIEVNSISENALNKLSHLEGIGRMNAFNGANSTRLEFQVLNSKDILPQVLETIVNTGGKITSCTTKNPDLSEIFNKLIEEREFNDQKRVKNTQKHSRNHVGLYKKRFGH